MICSFIPPHMAEKVSETDETFESGILVDERLRDARQSVMGVSGPIRVYNASNRTAIPGALVQGEDEVADRVRANAVLIGQLLGTDEFPDGVVRYGQGYANAFFNGNYLIFGEGDGQVFGDFTYALDIMAHEFGHALISMGPKLMYQNEPGALNEHFCDVVGACVQQSVKNDQTDWLIGQEILIDKSSSVRNMLNPGTAYDNAVLGRDPQPGHMDHYQKVSKDNGGVHINSGIPNRAFALLCENTQEPSWGRPLAMWRRSLMDLGPRSGFKDMAKATVRHSGGLAPAVQEAWAAVGIRV